MTDAMTEMTGAIIDQETVAGAMAIIRAGGLVQGATVTVVQTEEDKYLGGLV